MCSGGRPYESKYSPRVYQHRGYYKRTLLDKHQQSSLEVRLWRQRHGRHPWFVSRAPTHARSDSCLSVGEYDVFVLVDFQHRLEFAVRNNIHRLGECRCEVNFDTQVTLLHQAETRPVAGVWCHIKPEEGVAVAEV